MHALVQHQLSGVVSAIRPQVQQSRMMGGAHLYGGGSRTATTLTAVAATERVTTSAEPGLNSSYVSPKARVALFAAAEEQVR